MLNTYTIHVIVEEVAGEFRYSAAVKELPECYTEASDLKSLFDSLSENMALRMDPSIEPTEAEKEHHRNIFEQNHPEV